MFRHTWIMLPPENIDMCRERFWKAQFSLIQFDRYHLGYIPIYSSCPYILSVSLEKYIDDFFLI